MRSSLKPEAAAAGPGAVPSLAISYDCQDRRLLERVLPAVNYVEVAPDALARVRGDHVELRPDAIAELIEFADDVGVVVHGTSLSIGSYDGWSETYLRLLD